jgi:Txe/YoeB family toxin of Txe-Axe toxin-antitoxin module
MRIIKPSEVVFANEKIGEAFRELKEEDDLKKSIKRAILDIQTNAYSGIQIPKRLFPKEYVLKYKINNLWKYDLPDGWRLIYTLNPLNRVEILSVILEWFNNKDYERRFHY